MADINIWDTFGLSQQLAFKHLTVIISTADGP